MRRGTSAAAWLLAALLALAALPAAAGAHPDEAGELYVPWASSIDKQRSVQFMQGSRSARPAASSSSA